MKKLSLLLIIFALSNCEIKVRKTSAQTSQFYSNYSREIVRIDGMDYVFVYKTDGSSQTGYCVATINLTKDKLEVELLKKQLNN
jgi:hypothetical protein